MKVFRRRDDPVYAVLLSAMRGGAAPEDLSSFSASELVDPATAHGLNHVLLGWLAKVAPDHRAVPVLSALNRQAAVFNMQVLGALRNVLNALDTATGAGGAIPSVVFKGPVLAHLATPAGARAYGDLDVLVEPRRFSDAVDAILRSGATLHEVGGWKARLDAGYAQVPFNLPLGVQLDLHAHLCSSGDRRRAFRVADASTLIGRREWMDLGIGRVPVPALEDMLLHTAAHGGWSGGERLGWLVDVDSIVRSGDVDWNTVARRAREWGVAALVHDVLRRAVLAVGTPVPDDVLADLRRTSGSLLLEAASRLDPNRVSTFDYGMARLLRQETGGNAGATAWALTRRLGLAGRRRFGLVPKISPLAQARVPELDEPYRAEFLSFIGSLDRPANPAADPAEAARADPAANPAAAANPFAAANPAAAADPADRRDAIRTSPGRQR